MAYISKIGTGEEVDALLEKVEDELDVATEDEAQEYLGNNTLND